DTKMLVVNCRSCRGRGHLLWASSFALSSSDLDHGDPMYQPDHYRVEDVAQMHALMRARPLAALVSCGSSGLSASHLPTVLKNDGAFGVIEYHLARANPHWKDLAEGNDQRSHVGVLGCEPNASRRTARDRP